MSFLALLLRNRLKCLQVLAFSPFWLGDSAVRNDLGKGRAAAMGAFAMREGRGLRRRHLLLTGTSVAAILLCTAPVLAQVSSSGAVYPAQPINPSASWVVPGSIDVGYMGTGSLTIEAGGTVEVTGGSSTWVGRLSNGDGTVEITGAGSEMRILDGGMVIGGSDATGVVTVENGGYLDIDGDASFNGTQTVLEDWLFVGGGANGAGTLNVLDGGIVDTTLFQLGYVAGSTGTVVLDGTGSQINVDESMLVGGGGIGSLVVSGGAQLNTSQNTALPASNPAYGNHIGSYGSESSVTVTGSGSRLTSGADIDVGGLLSGPNAALIVEDDAEVEIAGTLLIGRGRVIAEPNAISRLILDNARLEADFLQMADGGAQAYAEIRNGAELTTGAFYAGGGATTGGGTTYWSDLNILLTGAGTVWNNTSTSADGFRYGATESTIEVFDQARLAIAGGMEIGMFSTSNDPSSAILSIDSGGVVDVEGSVSVGNDNDGSATVLMSGAGSEFDIGLDLIVGDTGSGEFTVTDGTVTQGGNTPNGSSSATIVANTAGAEGYLRLLGPDAVLNATALDIGRGGDGRTFVWNGGQAEAQLTALGRLSTGYGLLSVADSGSYLNAGNLNIGVAGEGRMIVSNGGTLDSIVATIGDLAGSEGSVSVFNPDSSWTNSTTLTVGSRGEGVLSISDGASVETEHAFIGAAAGSFGRIRVSAADSVFDTGLDLYVGDAGTGELLISDGGEVRQGDDTPNLGSSATYIGRQAGASGEILVTGAGSEFDGMTTFVGSFGQGSFTVADGAYAQTYLSAGNQLGGVGRVRVTGAGSHLYAPPIDIGFRGQGYLEILDGGYVDTGSLAYIGTLATGEGHALVSGSGSHWQTGIFSVGSLGSGTLTVADGGYVEAGIVSYIGEGVDSSGTATVTGTGSRWETGGELAVGWFGDASLTIADQGLVEAASVTIADQTGSTGALVVGTTQGSGRLEAATVGIGDGVGAIAGLGTIVGDVTVGNGILSPGAGTTLGTLTVDGDVTFGAGSRFAVRIAGDGNNDRVATTTASLGGDVVVSTVNSAASFIDGQTYTILTSSDPVGVTGTFSGVSMANSAFLTPTLTHNSDNVELSIALTSDFTSAALTPNQLQAAQALDGLEQSGDALAVFNTIAAMDAQSAREAFDLSSGEIHATGQHLIDQTFALFGATLRQQALGGLGDDTQDASVPPLGYGPSSSGNAGTDAIAGATAPTLATGTAWLAPVGAFGQLDGDGNAAALRWGTGGLVGGYQGVIDIGSGEAVAGLGFAYQRSRATVGDRLSEMDANGFSIGAYGAWTDGPWTLGGSLGYGINHVSTARDIAFLGRTAEADYRAHTLGLSAEAAYSFDLTETTRIAPLFTLDAGWSGRNGFTETGAGALNITAGAESWARLNTGIGLALTHELVTETGVVVLDARAVWEHGYGDLGPDASVALAGSPTGFTVEGAAPARDRLRLGAGAAWDVSDTMTINLRYEGDFSSTHSNHAIGVGLSASF